MYCDLNLSINFKLIIKFMDWNRSKCISVLYVYLKPHIYISYVR